MRLNHADVVLDFLGEPLKQATEVDKDGKPTASRDLTFRDLAYMALHTVVEGVKPPTAEAKARIYAISGKLYRGKFVNLTVDEAAFVKDRAGEVLSPLGYGRLCDWLEGRPQMVAVDVEDDEDADPPA